MPERKTVGQLMEEMRLKAGAQNYHGHEYMDLEPVCRGHPAHDYLRCADLRFPGGLER